MKWWREFKNPKLKCERLGHLDKTQRVTIRMDDDSRVAAHDYDADLTICKRCKRELKPQNLEYKTYWTSVSMPSEMFDEMKEKGYLVLN